METWSRASGGRRSGEWRTAKTRDKSGGTEMKLTCGWRSLCLGRVFSVGACQKGSGKDSFAAGASMSFLKDDDFDNIALRAYGDMNLWGRRC